MSGKGLTISLIGNYGEHMNNAVNASWQWLGNGYVHNLSSEVLLEGGLEWLTRC
jgi:subtilase family serine protease